MAFVPNIPPPKQLRIYQATIKWMKENNNKNKDCFRQEYVIVAENEREARAIAQNHRHPLLFNTKEYEDNITIKDFGPPQNVTTFYTSPIFPDTYKPVLPGKPGDIPTDPATDKNYLSANDKDILKLRETLKTEQENTKKQQENWKMEEAKWQALLNEKEKRIQDQQQALLDKEISLTESLAENNRTWEKKLEDNKKEQTETLNQIDILKRQNQDMKTVKKNLEEENKTLKTEKENLKTENEKLKKKINKNKNKTKESPSTQTSDGNKYQEQEQELIDISLKMGMLAVMILQDSSNEEERRINDEIMNEFQRDHNVPKNYFEYQEKEKEQGREVTSIENYVTSLIRQRQKNKQKK